MGHASFAVRRRVFGATISSVVVRRSIGVAVVIAPCARW